MFDSMAIWKAKTEGKHRFFTWLLVQNRILTADNLSVRNWPCNPMCPMCDQHLETADHLCLQCVFAQGVWVLVAHWSDGVVQVPDSAASLEGWRNSSLAALAPEFKKHKATLMIYTVWNLWVERNRRVFQGLVSSEARILHLIKDEMALRTTACEVQVSSGVY
jgi:hypothetical protein